MNIEWKVGSFYKSRDGQKWECLKTDMLTPEKIVLTNNLSVELYYLNGRWYQSQEDEQDIISEWIEEPIIDWDAMPRWIDWVAMDESGKWYCYENEPIKSMTSWDRPTGLFHKIPQEYYPKNAPTDWKQCKFKRP
ncbi:MAG: hypothetical protein FGM14_15090 [Flavobacteriales bacterium]|nr:hypothetical protein [Flavobacteriales bacterium]